MKKMKIALAVALVSAVASAPAMAMNDHWKAALVGAGGSMLQGVVTGNTEGMGTKALIGGATVGITGVTNTAGAAVIGAGVGVGYDALNNGRAREALQGQMNAENNAFINLKNAYDRMVNSFPTTSEVLDPTRRVATENSVAAFQSTYAQFMDVANAVDRVLSGGGNIDLNQARATHLNLLSQAKQMMVNLNNVSSRTGGGIIYREMFTGERTQMIPAGGYGNTQFQPGYSQQQNLPPMQVYGQQPMQQGYGQPQYQQGFQPQYQPVQKPGRQLIKSSPEGW